jgi:hypothetical protein
MLGPFTEHQSAITLAMWISQQISGKKMSVKKIPADVRTAIISIMQENPRLFHQSLLDELNHTEET